MKFPVRILRFIIILVAVMLIAFFSLRNFVLHKLIEKAAVKFKSDYELQFSVGDYGFNGFSTVTLNKILVTPASNDTLVIIDSCMLQPSLTSLLIFRLRLNEVNITNASIHLSCRNNSCNYSSLLHNKSDRIVVTKDSRDYASFLNRLFGKVFNLAPQHSEIKNVSVSYENENAKEQVLIPYYVSSENELSGNMRNVNTKEEWEVAGNFSQRNKTMDVKIYPVVAHTAIPLAKNLFNAECSFDTVRFSIQQNEYKKGEYNIGGNFSVTEFSLEHQKISDEPVIVHSASFDYKIKVAKNFVELDSTSFAMLNALHIHPYFRYTNDGKKEYALQLHTDNQPANDLFQSLPKGMFDELHGVEADGNLSYSLNFVMNTSQPDSVIFDSQLKKEKFHLTRYGSNSLLKMNEEFMYTVYENDRAVRTFAVGPSNPQFVPLNQISPYLRNAILTSEDGSFFFHNGFNPDAFRKSIAANYKAGKFARGGSTISMQLVKNVFLTRHKTISRKAEEALIVWLIESNRLCSKERMYEVYLNIIELGPGVYGISEASQFYFKKKPSELTLPEGIFIASLLPRPKWFKYSFDEGGNLKPYFGDYFRVVANFLLKKELITQKEYDELQPHVELKGFAKQLVTPSDTIPLMEEEEN